MDRREGVGWLWRAAQQGYREAKADLRALADAGVIQAAAPLHLPYISPISPYISPIFPYISPILYLPYISLSYSLYLPYISPLA